MKWIYQTNDPLLETLGGCVIIFILIILVTRIIGLRSFAKFTAYDFAFTIAIGSIVSAVLTSSTSLTHGFIAIAGLLVLTYIVSALQKKFPGLSKTISNQPILLMDGSKILYDNLKSSQIQEAQLIAKLREANVLNFDQVYAVVLESTGDISVLHKSSSQENENLDHRLLMGVAHQNQKQES